MKKIFLMAVLAPLLSLSQEKYKNKSTDSLEYYKRELSQLYRKSHDSLRASAVYREAWAGINRHMTSSDRYFAFVLFMGVTNADLDKFNQDISRSGFEKMKSTVPSVGLGFSAQIRRTMIDFYVFNAGFPAKSKKGDETVKFNLVNFFQFDLGYDVIKSKSVGLYPYAGISIRAASLSYSKPMEMNPAFTNISDFVLNDRSIDFSSSRIGYQAGLGFDVTIAENNYSKKVLFVKGGLNRPIGGEKFESKELKYDPQIKSGIWGITFGIKFADKS
jgi:hypothetical protein